MNLTSGYLFFSAHRYIARPLVIIPLDDKFHVATRWPNYDYLGEFTSDELAIVLRVDFEKQQRIVELRKDHEQQLEATLSSIQIEL